MSGFFICTNVSIFYKMKLQISVRGEWNGYNCRNDKVCRLWKEKGNG